MSLMAISNDLSSLPLEHLISTPLQSAIKAQALASQSSVQFFQDVCLDKGDGTDNYSNVKMFDMKYKKTTKDGEGNDKSIDSTISVPLATILPIPYIKINNLSIDFDFKVSEYQEEETKSVIDVSGSAKHNWLTGGITLKGSYSRQNNAFSRTGKKAHLHINVMASEREMPSGMEKLLTILENEIASV